MNKISKLFCLFVIPLVSFYTSSVFAYVEKDVAFVRIMNKAAGKTQVMPVNVGQTINYEEMTITVHNCKQTDPFDAENFFVFLEIYTKTDGRVFSGWMNHNEPGQNPLQNDAWDVWLEKCE